ncbi:MAG: hypothetical protein L6R40_006561 [Gallowayella cf. fulva]|nr:MAG: hypothetical protein L6R40_006561 [Xanthomendoza cf. fulva]
MPHSEETSETEPSSFTAHHVRESGIPTSTRQPGHQRFVLTDPAAFRYLEEDPSTTVLERRRPLAGYELYFVEQWACSRIHPTFVITTFTGLEQHSVFVGIISVPMDEEAWSPRLRVYFKAIAKYHARKKETPLGTLMVTNLSAFPSALTVILVPDGDMRKHREDFIVNENLKRMGCAGRAGLSLSHPVQATEAKFNRLYRTSDRIALYSAVIELVKLCQAALVLFGKLAPEYADGLLCDVTEQAINDWWSDIGSDIYRVEPSDGILGPTTVAAIIGLLIGARNRLHAYGAPVAKDVFDLASTKRGLAYFQKGQKVERTRRLDRPTLHQLHRATTKAAKSSEGWNVPRAVKSTVAELSGKGGDLAAGEAREKAGFADIETLDIETFIQLASGERAKWLWYGKPRKSETDVFKQLGGEHGMVLENDEKGGFTWSRKQQRNSVLDDQSRHGLPAPMSHGLASNVEGYEKDQAQRKNVLKSVTGRMTDARSGLGRIRDAVGMRGHHHRYSREAGSFSEGESLKDRSMCLSDELMRESTPIGPASQRSSRAPLPNDSANVTPSSPRSRRNSSLAREGLEPFIGTTGPLFQETTPSDRYAAWEVSVDSESEEEPSGTVSEADSSIYPSAQAKGAPPNKPKDFPKIHGDLAVKAQKGGRHIFLEAKIPRSLRRTSSQPQLSQSTINKEYFQYRWPRHLSFSTVVDVVAANEDEIVSRSEAELEARKHPDAALALEKTRRLHAQQLNESLRNLQEGEGFWVKRRVGDIEDVDAHRARDQEALDTMYRQKVEEHESLKEASSALLAGEKSGLEEAAKDVETLGAKLEYELNTLESKVEDVENAVSEFERQVEQVELRAAELYIKNAAKHSWVWWPFRLPAKT